jgi:hypothetical protein
MTKTDHRPEPESQSPGGTEGEPDLSPEELKRLRALLAIHKEVVEERLRKELPDCFQKSVSRSANSGKTEGDQGRGI